MKTFKHIALAFTALLLVTSCAIDEMWEGMDTQDEEKVLTFKPKFEDFETVTKAIGDGSKVDKLLVHVYEYEGDNLKSYEFDIRDCAVIEDVSIPFFYGKKYKVYFWAYSSSNDAYTIADGGLKNGVTVNYPESTAQLTYESLEYLDAFYSVKDIDLSNTNKDVADVKLTRPFAQVNLAANSQQLKDANATAVSFKIKVASKYIPGGEVLESVEYTFTFSCDNNFQGNAPIDESGNLYLGTMYIPVSGDNKITAEVTLTDKMGNKLKYSSDVEIPLVSNNRTNLVFEGVKPAWNDDKCNDSSDVPSDVVDDWIHITTPEELAALLIFGGSDGAQYHICNDLDLTGMPSTTKEKINGTVAFNNITVDAFKTAGDGCCSVKNIKGVKAFLGSASGITVQNLVIDGFEISGNTHVGVLVNTLSGENTFKNVTIQNSSATTTTGAAGGMVGYIVRSPGNDRAETLSVTIDGCKVNNTSASGTLAEGKFVGLLSGYDNGEQLVFTSSCSTDANTSVTDWTSPYIEGNEGAWLASNDYSSYNGWLGDEVYYRGKVYFGGTDEATNRFCRKWDGTTTVAPLLANEAYDAGTTAGPNRFVVYSPFDLAGVRKETASPAAIYLKSDVDMNGQGADGKFNVPTNFTQSVCSSTDDNVFNPFDYVTTLDGYRDESTNHSIYNLSIAQIEQERAAFILYASGTTVHKNINFRNCQTVAVHKPVATDAKAYGAILVSNVDATYTMENVHAYDCKVFALQKVGTLGARISGTSTLRNNSVNNCYVENYECNISERFDSGNKEIAGMTARVYADFYPHGEVGGMYGFIQGISNISNCKVNATIIYGFGQNDKKATVEGDGLAQAGIAALGYYLVPGRHVSTFIGNIRATGAITITNCTVDSVSKCTNRWDTHQWRVKTGGSWLRPTYTYYKWDYIGQAYYVEFLDSKGSVTVDGTALTLGDCKDGTLYGTK